jgi:malonyl-CoA O-methyltransferase
MLGRHQAEARRVCADACALPFRDGSFDLVCSSLMAGDLLDLGGWIREAARVLAPGGYLVYSDFHPEWSKQGWRRTFTAPNGELIEVPYVPHPLDEHLEHCRDRRLLVRAIREPRVAGKTAPVVIVFHLEKPRSATAAALDEAR